MCSADPPFAHSWGLSNGGGRPQGGGGKEEGAGALQGFYLIDLRTVISLKCVALEKTVTSSIQCSAFCAGLLGENTLN